MSSVLDRFGPATRAWFGSAFAGPTPVQEEGWRRIAAGEHALLCAPTGSGKTLAAFLWCLDRLTRMEPSAEAGIRVVYVSPLKALAYDVERNLRVPLGGIELQAKQLGLQLRTVRPSVRTGDTSPRDRRLMARDPGDILITTPESLYLMLGSQARELLRSADTVIVDEIHALAPGKRGAHLMLSLERLVELTGREPQRIGLSATQRPLEEVARFLGGARPVAIVDAGEPPRLSLTIEVPVEDMEKPQGDIGPPPPRSKVSREAPPDADSLASERGIWPAIYPRLLELVRAHESTIIFTNSRRLCERLAQRLNELADENLVRAHHGSVARQQREEIEEMLKSGQLRGIVATSSLELGIDMGAVDLVVQIESPGAVSRGLQRIGRAGHSVGERSVGTIFPKYRGDLLEAAVVGKQMLAGNVEPIRVPRRPLDVLAQQIVAMCAVDPWPVEKLLGVVRRSYGFADLSRELLVAVLDMLSGRYPSDAFSELRPRIVWDRASDVLTARGDAKMLALTNAGTIPDRGLYGVYLGADGPRLGELDEEMVHESRPGQTFLLGATTWRIVEITRDKVIVAPAPGEPGRMPFWRGEGPGRPIELGRALGEFLRELGEKAPAEAQAWLESEYMLDARAARNLLRYVDEQKAATGELPSDRTLVIERFRDELGDWRVCILSPFGARVHAPWALALETRVGAAQGFEVQTLWSDDGIVLRFADTDELPSAATLLPDPDDVEELVLEQLGDSAIFSTHFREAAGRALLLPRRRPGKRTPLWAQRQRAQTLLAAARQHPGFPIVLETYRECMNDVFDVPSLVELLRAVRRRDVRVVEVETRSASPFARSLAFAYVSAYLYEGDAPLAERRAQALTIDRNLLRELLGQEELRELLDPAVLDEAEAELQALVEDRQAHSADGLHDLLRRVGELTEGEARVRASGDVSAWLAELRKSGRAFEMGVGGEERWVAVEDVAKVRDALGSSPPSGVPEVFLEKSEAPLESLLARYARTHGPFVSSQPAGRFAIPPAQVEASLRALCQAGRLLEGEFRPGGSGREWCDPDVLRLLRRRTLAHLRNEVASVESSALARFLPRWHGVGERRGGLPRLREVLEQLEGIALPYSELETSILPARISDFTSRMLDELGALGELVWIGRGALGSDDGRIALYRRERVPFLVEPPQLPEDPAPLHRAFIEQLEKYGASFFAQLERAAATVTPSSQEVLQGLWDLVWMGLITNDTFQPLRALGRPLTPRGRMQSLLAGGRWSLVSQLIAGPPLGDTERAHARALTLLERWGIVSREAVSFEAIPGGLPAMFPVLRAMEDAGKVRRGYFVEGLGGSQYAQPGVVDRLRAARNIDESDRAVALAAVDPANVWGALLPWPDATEDGNAKPSRRVGATVVLYDGTPTLYLESSGKRLRVFAAGGAAPPPEVLRACVDALRRHAARLRHRQLRVDRVNGEPALRSPLVSALENAGFRTEPNSLVLDVGS